MEKVNQITKTIEVIKNNYDNFRELFNSTNDQLKSKMTTESESIRIVSSIPGVREPTREKDRLLHLTISTVIDMIKNS